MTAREASSLIFGLTGLGMLLGFAVVFVVLEIISRIRRKSK